MKVPGISPYLFYPPNAVKHGYCWQTADYSPFPAQALTIRYPEYSPGTKSWCKCPRHISKIHPAVSEYSSLQPLKLPGSCGKILKLPRHSFDRSCFYRALIVESVTATTSAAPPSIVYTLIVSERKNIPPITPTSGTRYSWIASLVTVPLLTSE